MDNESFIDNLLNFSVPEEEEEKSENEEVQPHRETDVRQTDSFGLLNCDDPAVEEEEELEWITNKDAFPMIEAFVDELPAAQINLTLLTEGDQLSPVSVLETSSGSVTTSNSSGPSNASAATETTTTVMNYCVGFKAPGKARSKRLRTGRRDFPVLWTSNSNEKGGIKKKMKTPSVVAAAVPMGRKCTHCGAEQTPQWRAGPLGPKTLCNACGVRYKSGRLVPEYRPANSPSFTPELHSNSHRKIVEMRKKFQSGDGDRKDCR